MKTSELLKKAKAVIDTPEKWCKQEFAKTENGEACEPNRTDAACFCTLGALRKICGGDKDSYLKAKMKLAKMLPEKCKQWNIPDFNDRLDTTHADIMAWFDRAIANAEAQGD